MDSHMVSSIPRTLTYESASVLSLAVSSAACGLFQKDQLALQYPSVRAKPTGKMLLVWGDASSVSRNAIQLAVAASYEVISTASPKKFDYVEKLGASQVFDYNSKTVVKDLIHAFKGKTCASAFTVDHGAADACMDILDKCKGDKFISMASYPLPPMPPKRFLLLSIALYYVFWNISHWIKCRLRHIRSNFIFGLILVDNGVGNAIYEDFLLKALAEGAYIAAPDAYVVGKGLEYIQAALDIQKNGASAKKVVVAL